MSGKYRREGLERCLAGEFSVRVVLARIKYDLQHRVVSFLPAYPSPGGARKFIPLLALIRTCRCVIFRI